AALQLFLAGEKLFDDRVDRDGVLPRVAAKLLHRDVAAGEATLRALDFPLDAIRATLRSQPAVEADPTADLDALAAPTASALGDAVGWLVRAAGSPDHAAAAQFAAALGRQLHLVDALVDLRRDLARGKVNAIARAVGDLTPGAVHFLANVHAGRVRALRDAFD